jgi:hypothetical protein
MRVATRTDSALVREKSLLQSKAHIITKLSTSKTPVLNI